MAIFKGSIVAKVDRPIETANIGEVLEVSIGESVTYKILWNRFGSITYEPASNIVEVGELIRVTGESQMQTRNGRWEYLFDTKSRRSIYYHVDCDAISDESTMACVSCGAKIPGIPAA